MTIYEKITGGVCAPAGFSASGVHCGIRKNKSKKDLALIYSKVPCTAAAVYTQNKVKGAPITVTKRHLENGTAQAVLCNSGNANTCNADGIQIADAMCESLAGALGIPAQDVVIASTGVIGQPLPLEPITSHMGELVDALSPEGGNDAAQAIMTTDTTVKEVAVCFPLGGKTCTVGGIAKGSGMIHPNMATMLCFLTTDAAISAGMLQKACKAAADETFNMISVDGDTSTNDTMSILASGLAGNAAIESEGEDYTVFLQGLTQVSRTLSKMMAADGEGATKLMECTVSGAPGKEVAKQVAKSVITSTLFKAALFGADANWGRVLCAIGYTDAEFDIDKVDVSFSSKAGKVDVCKDGAGVDFSEELAKAVLLENEITVHINMNQGDGQATAWGCDLTYDYVKINGDYRT